MWDMKAQAEALSLCGRQQMCKALAAAARTAQANR